MLLTKPISHRIPNHNMSEKLVFQFNKIQNASVFAEWFFFFLGIIFCVISVIGNSYVSYRLVKIIRASKAIQTPIYLSLTVCGLMTGVCMPFMLYAFYKHRIENPDLGVTALLDTRGVTTSYHGNVTHHGYYTSNFTTYTYTYFASTTTFGSTLDNCSDETFGMSIAERVLCNITGAVFNMTSRLIVWIMLLLSVDRYIFICKPYRIYLVKKQHYVAWIVVFAAIVIILATSPFVSYHREAIDPGRPAYCPMFVFSPYKFVYPTSYVPEFQPLVLLNSTVGDLGPGPLIFYILTIVVFLLFPILSNVVLSLKVFYEVVRMRNMTQVSVRYAKAGARYTQITECGGTTRHAKVCSSPMVGSPSHDQAGSPSSQCGEQGDKRHLPVLLKLHVKMKALTRWVKRGTMVENKASFTMIVLSLFHIITYFAWVMLWIDTIRMYVNLEKRSQAWTYLYHSRNMFAYNVVNHYPQATFANAAFVPCLLGYSLHRGRRLSS